MTKEFSHALESTSIRPVSLGFPTLPRVSCPTRAVRFGYPVAVAVFAVAFNLFAQGSQSEWASVDGTGKLVYKTLPTGDRIMDFSYAGYMGGGVKIPGVLAAKTVAPSGGDDTAAVQSAIDEVSQLPLINGLRGAVLLKPGTFHCNGALAIKTSGVVLRGYGPTRTTIQMSGDPHVCITVEGSKPATGAPVAITDGYVPAGAMTFHVTDASSFAEGDAIIVQRPDTSAWIAFMGCRDRAECAFELRLSRRRADPAARALGHGPAGG